MATLTIRNLDDSVRDRLRDAARLHGRSTEAEVRHILEAATREGVPLTGRRPASNDLSQIEPVTVEGPESGREYLDHLRDERL